MTDDAAVTCRRCGFSNQAGDQFCGSCGAFLEWEGEPAADAAADPGADAAADAATMPFVVPGAGQVHDEGLGGLVRAGTGSSPSAMPAAAAAPPPLSRPDAPTEPQPVAAAAAGLLRCPACGIANAPTRTFCQSCGTRLTDASRVTAASREQIAAAVAARPVIGPGPAASTGAAGSARTGAARTEPAGGSSRGIAGWVVAVALLGILAGVGIVAASVLLRGQGPVTGATSAPTTGASGAPSAATGAAASTAPTAALAPAPLPLTGATASSVVGDLPKFQPQKAIDGDVATCWQEGVADERGQWIEVSFDPARVDAVVLNNGYGASTALYKGNLRLKKVEISVDGGTPLTVTLKDTAQAQTIALGEHPGATRVRITIVSTFKSVKTSVAGTPFDDAALSEIAVIGLVGG